MEFRYNYGNYGIIDGALLLLDFYILVIFVSCLIMVVIGKDLFIEI